MKRVFLKLGSHVFSTDMSNTIFMGLITMDCCHPEQHTFPPGEAAFPACVYLLLNTFTNYQQMILQTQQSIIY